jgi:hypothetical protein
MTTAVEMLQKYLDAEAAILEGKTVRFGERLLSHEDLQWVQAGRREWKTKAAAETAASPTRAFYRNSISMNGHRNGPRIPRRNSASVLWKGIHSLVGNPFPTNVPEFGIRHFSYYYPRQIERSLSLVG